LVRLAVTQRGPSTGDAAAVPAIIFVTIGSIASASTA
jgi:hypothetical protein